GLCMADICGIGYPIGGTGSNGGDKEYVTTAPQHAGGVGVEHSSGAGYTGDLPAAAHGDSNQLVRKGNEWYLTIYPGIDLPAHHPQSDSIAAEIRSEMEKNCAGFDYYCAAPRKDANGFDMGAQARLVAKARACPKSCHGGDLWLTPAAVIEALTASATLGNSNSVSSYTGQHRGRPQSVSGRKVDCKCFLAGTDVLMADGSTKDIENIKLGDKVLATDPKTGKTGPRKVTRLIRTEGDKRFNELSIATKNGIEKLTATHGHPFWSPSQHDWIPAGSLKPGMTLRTTGGHTVIVTGNHPFTKHTRTYNLTVSGLHTYYVLAGATPVLVHDSNCPFNMTPLGNGSMLSPAGLIYNPGSSDGHRLRHVLRHGTRGTTDPSKATHTQFNSHGRELLNTVDEAWQRRGTPLSVEGTDEYIVPMGRTIGTQGQTDIKIVTESGSSRIIMAHPV
ncbi:Hint domain-containing protein, partial [Streptomyces sp. NPDC058398]|uniref:Hint domain-containing protein n=1 Tax=Streptomyces sp. NPDC058398 TaxID=3346479 RepID=UPI00364C50E8